MRRDFQGMEIDRVVRKDGKRTIEEKGLNWDKKGER